MRRTIRLTESDLHRVIKETVKRILKETTFDGVGFYVSVDEDIFTPQEINEITSIGEKYGVDYDGMGSYYVYNTNDFNNFIREIKQLNLGKIIYLYKGEEPDFEWHSIGQEII